MSLKRIITADKDIQLIQDNTDNALTPLQNSPLVNGNLLSNLNLISGQDNLINHNLGHVPTASIAGIPNVNTTIWSPGSPSINNQSSNSQVINLRCSTSCTVSVWVK